MWQRIDAGNGLFDESIGLYGMFSGWCKSWDYPTSKTSIALITGSW
jgi:hypothetical protein